MTNAIFSTGPVTKEVSAKVERFRFVQLDENGKVKHAGADALPYGHIGQPAAPQAREDQDVSYGLPEWVAVNTHQAVVEVAFDGEIKPGAKVYMAADGKAAASGSVVVGLAESAPRGGTVRVHMFHPAALSA